MKLSKNDKNMSKKLYKPAFISKHFFLYITHVRAPTVTPHPVEKREKFEPLYKYYNTLNSTEAATEDEENNSVSLLLVVV